MNKYLAVILVFSLSILSSFSQKKEKKYTIRTVAFYNLENLFDTINDVTKNDEASPMMELKGNKSKVYWDKIDKLGSVIAAIGEEKAKTSPAIIGVSEVENREVLEDVINDSLLFDKGYDIIHYNSPDVRGIDVALLYQKKLFTPINTSSHELKIYDDNTRKRVYTRDQLLVSGKLDGEMIHIIVNHW